MYATWGRTRTASVCVCVCVCLCVSVCVHANLVKENLIFSMRKLARNGVKKVGIASYHGGTLKDHSDLNDLESHILG